MRETGVINNWQSEKQARACESCPRSHCWKESETGWNPSPRGDKASLLSTALSACWWPVDLKPHYNIIYFMIPWIREVTCKLAVNASHLTNDDRSLPRKPDLCGVELWWFSNLRVTQSVLCSLVCPRLLWVWERVGSGRERSRLAWPLGDMLHGNERK